MNNIRIPIKPLSVNDAFQGRRFKTPEHKKWTESVLFLLPKFTIPPPPYQLYLKFGFANSQSDWDNPVKQIQDALASKYGFNDKLIRRAIVETEIVGRGNEYIEWNLTTLNS